MTAPRLALLVTLLATGPAAAAPRVALPAVNLGGSSFLDGLGGPGLLLRETVLGYHAAGPGDDHVDALTALTHVAWTAPWPLLGCWWGAEVIVPLVEIDVTAGPVAGRQGGLGDVTVSPLLLQLPTIGGLHHKLDLDLILPTGRYAATDPVTVGAHVVSVNPFYAATLLAGPAELSLRAYYLWNGANDAPSPAFAARSIQPGQAVHLNLAASLAVGGGLRVGVAGYALAQLTDARVDGHLVAGARERVLAIGPGALYAAGPLKVVGNAYVEFATANRPSGTRLGLTVVHVW
jgi:hypothetical protein